MCRTVCRMASLKKFPRCKFWYACYTMPDGKRVQRSTKQTDRKKAQKIADEVEMVWKDKLSARQTQRLIAEVYEKASGTNLHSESTTKYFNKWLGRRKGEVADTTFKFYRSKALSFLKFLGGKSDDPIQDVSPQDVLRFRDEEVKRVKPATVNHGVKFLRIIFEDAKRDCMIADNPAEGVRLLKKTDTLVRRPFTLEEIRKVLAVSDNEWKSIIMFGLYTGQRLKDIALLKWLNLDLDSGEVRIRSSKTRRSTVIPIAPPLLEHIRGLDGGYDPEAYVHGIAAGRVEAQGKTGTLSRQFREILVKAGLAEKRPHRKADRVDNGRVGRRLTSPLSFHSLRHTATSMLKNAGVSSAVVQDIIGHESAAMSAIYTHIDEATKKSALDKMPDIRGDTDE